MSVQPCKSFFATVAASGPPLHRVLRDPDCRRRSAGRDRLRANRHPSRRTPRSRHGVKSRTYPPKFKSGGLRRGGRPHAVFLSFSRNCLRNLATFGSTTIRQYGWWGLRAKYFWW